MPFAGLGLHVLIAIFFAVHCVRSGRETYWLFILFSFPFLGSVAYFFAVYLPGTRLEHTVRKSVLSAARSLDPERELREARQAFDLTPTAQNQMRLAAAMLEAGSHAEAAQLYETCLQGPFASDPEMRFGAARARLENGQARPAIDLAEAIRKDSPAFRPEAVSTLLANAYSLAGQHGAARNEFHSAVTRFGTVDARAEFAIWLLSIGDNEAANSQLREIEKAMKHWSRQTKSHNRPMLNRLEAAFAAARKT